MRNPIVDTAWTRNCRSMLALIVTLVIACGFGARPAVAQSTDATLSVHFVGLKSAQGAVMVALFNSEAAYENSTAATTTALRALKLEISNGTALATLQGLAPGQYAIKAYHDINGDAKLNFNLFGMPTEPVAFSNDAPVHMHAPSWSQTAFTVHPGENSISIHLE
jgi:uncharacterized protein (DUF2141 family)